jgi:hypothetical protein
MISNILKMKVVEHKNAFMELCLIKHMDKSAGKVSNLQNILTLNAATFTNAH